MSELVRMYKVTNWDGDLIFAHYDPFVCLEWAERTLGPHTAITWDAGADFKDRVARAECYRKYIVQAWDQPDYRNINEA